jgi:hypothetical protein
MAAAIHHASPVFRGPPSNDDDSDNCDVYLKELQLGYKHA